MGEVLQKKIYDSLISVLFFYFKCIYVVFRITDFTGEIVGIFHPLTVFICACIFPLKNYFSIYPLKYLSSDVLKMSILSMMHSIDVLSNRKEKGNKDFHIKSHLPTIHCAVFSGPHLPECPDWNLSKMVQLGDALQKHQGTLKGSVQCMLYQNNVTEAGKTAATVSWCCDPVTKRCLCQFKVPLPN